MNERQIEEYIIHLSKQWGIGRLCDVLSMTGGAVALIGSGSSRPERTHARAPSLGCCGLPINNWRRTLVIIYNQEWIKYVLV